MGKFHFFTDYDLLTTQSAIQAFGPAGTTNIGGIDYDQYRITSLHAASGAPKAYAVCDGTICVQIDNNNMNLVNIILKPLKQPAINFPPIQYFIYKGVKLDSLINISTSEILNTSTLDVIQSINNSQIAWNNSYDDAMSNPPGTTVDIASANSLGIHYKSSASPPDQVLDSDYIDLVFFKENVSYQLPNVKSGWSIGEFDNTNFGIEVVLEDLFLNSSMILSRQVENLINVKTISGGSTQAEVFEHWHDKEECTKYMDIVAFYGSLFIETISATDSSGNTSEKTGNDIFNDLLTSFFNKSKTYIDIKNNHNRSINYYGNYSTDIVVSFDSNPPQNINYYRSGWPIYIIDNSEIPTGNTDPKQLIKLSLPTGASSENPNPIIYFVQGYLYASFPKMPKENQRFISDLGNTGSFTNPIEIAVPNNDSLTDTIISSYNCFLYCNLPDSSLNTTSSNSSIRFENQFSYLFQPLNFNNFNLSVNSFNKVFGINKFASLELSNNFKGVFTTMFGKDSEGNVYLSAFPQQSIYASMEVDDVDSYQSSIVSEGNIFQKIASFDNYSFVNLEDLFNGQNIKISKFIRGLANNNSNLFNPFSHIVFNQSEIDNLNTIAISNNFLTKYGYYLNYINPDIMANDRDPKIKIYHFEIELIGFVISGSNISISIINTNIKKPFLMF